ncbi:MAG TPA: transglycosylase SLT domain-containing protein [Acidobacteriaceae bacterium]|nr:transglycosylase SLT domain-containing protein [Acidobacteriaceae bacterium]
MAHAEHRAARRPAYSMRRERELAYRRRHARRYYRHRLTARELARSRRIRRAFVASSQLRPMAQQLALMRTPAAYAGVMRYARAHRGDAAAAAYLALGNAYLLDHRFTDAVAALRQARLTGAHGVLDDFADYLTAQAYLQNNQLPQAEALLDGFDEKYPDSIFVESVPVLRANLYLQEGDPQRALQILNAHNGDAIAGHSDFQLALAKAEFMAGNTERATELYEHVYLTFPLSIEAGYARVQLQSTGVLDTLPPDERRRHADALYNAGHYFEAAEEYRALAGQPDTDGVTRDWLLVAAAECDWKMHRLTEQELDDLPDTGDDAGARRLYLEMELARERDDMARQQALVTEMEQRFPASLWLAQALFSSGNMYLLANDAPHAIDYYGELARRFPTSRYAPVAHWRAAWLNYRMGKDTEAARLFDEQIKLYPDSEQAVSALYWRGRDYEDRELQPAMAAAYYSTVVRLYPHYYYALMAQQRLAALSQVAPAHIAELDAMKPAPIPELTDDVPEDDPHVVEAKLLANAGLNEYIAPEIQAADGSAEWGAFAEAEIYASDGEAWRAMHLLKRELPFYESAPMDAIPAAYWKILFPEPYWSYIQSDAAKNGLNPYMVAALIRQETEFNPGAISGANAYGLMQLLPSVGRAMARQVGMRRFRTADLLDPVINLELGTRYLREMLDEFGGQPEYAFAAYNAGDYRVTAWRADGTWHGMDEFVESIPFTQTREYVQAILRNEAMYRELNQVTAERASR